MIQIDGSLGEGGGQILRTSIAMSAITGEKIKIKNIRVNRPNPGLRAQHISSIKAVAMLCNADVSGLDIGSKSVDFNPREIKGGRFSIDIGTAGSTALVLQALMIPAMHAKENVEIRITGGTDVRWSPTIDYTSFVFLPILKRFGYDAEIKLLKRGYYPAGGGIVNAVISPTEKLDRIDCTDFQKEMRIRGISHAHRALGNARVGERQAAEAKKIFRSSKIEIEYSDTSSYGSGITLWAECGRSILGACSIGERGKRAEDVGREAAEALMKEIENDASVDMHMADQLVPYIALFGGKIKTSVLTEHAKTNVLIMNLFGFDVKIDENEKSIFKD